LYVNTKDVIYDKPWSIYEDMALTTVCYLVHSKTIIFRDYLSSSKNTKISTIFEKQNVKQRLLCWVIKETEKTSIISLHFNIKFFEQGKQKLFCRTDSNFLTVYFNEMQLLWPCLGSFKPAEAISCLAFFLLLKYRF